MSSKLTNPFYRAQAILARRDHSEQELKSKLKQRGFSPAQINLAVAKLKKLHLLDDAQFAARYAEQALLSKPVGPRWLIYQLKRKGISANIINQTIAASYGSGREAGLAQEAVTRWQKTHPRYAADKIRLSRHLASRGFSAAVISAVISRPSTTALVS